MPPAFLRFECLINGLLGAQDGVFGGFGDAELDHFLGRNLDGGAGGGVASHARFAVDQDELAQAGEREGVLGVFVRQLRDHFQDLHGLFFCEFSRFSNGGGDLGFG